MHSHVTHFARASVLCAAILSTTLAATATGQTMHEDLAHPMHEDLAHRSPEIHWPAGFDPTRADLFTHNEAMINAPCNRVWSHLVDATKWPQWYPNTKNVHIVSNGDTVLHEGTVFTWTTFGLPFESIVHEYVPDSRIGWFGYAPGSKPTNYHTWYLAPKGDACNIIMEEAGFGPAAARWREKSPSLMHRGHDLWLATLKWISE
jgi:uncharacterized protein YndB with AHSA1/START domain